MDIFDNYKKKDPIDKGEVFKIAITTVIFFSIGLFFGMLIFGAI
jgi:hypothetical protein